MSMESVFKDYGFVIVISLLCAIIIWAIVRVLSTSAKKPETQGAPAVSAPVSVPAPVSAPAPAPASAPVSAPAPVPVPDPTPAMPVAANDDIPAEHIAAIAAAIHYMSGNVAILRIEDIRRRTAWVAQGRAVHHASHNPIRKR